MNSDDTNTEQSQNHSSVTDASATSGVFTSEGGDTMMRLVQQKLIARAEEGDRQDEVRRRTARAVLSALFGEGGSACHAMTGPVLNILSDEARAAAEDGVVGAQAVQCALEDARKAADAAFSEWLNYCRQK